MCRDRNGFEDVMGIDGYGERNVDGENILEICRSRQFKILNTMFKKEDKKKITYIMRIEKHRLITYW